MWKKLRKVPSFISVPSGEAPNATITTPSGAKHQLRAQQTPQGLAPLPSPARGSKGCASEEDDVFLHQGSTHSSCFVGGQICRTTSQVSKCTWWNTGTFSSLDFSVWTTFMWRGTICYRTKCQAKSAISYSRRGGDETLLILHLRVAEEQHSWM